jgi:hypothetical protein
MKSDKREGNLNNFEKVFLIFFIFQVVGNISTFIVTLLSTLTTVLIINLTMKAKYITY